MEQPKNTNSRSSIEVRYPFRHSLPLQVRFSDVDRLGHVNNNVYFAYFDLGKTEYFSAVRDNARATVQGVEACQSTNQGDKACQDVAEASLNQPVVAANVNCDFLAPIRPDEPIEVGTQIDRIGSKSFVMIQAITGSATGELKALCATTLVAINPRTGETVEIPTSLRTAVSAFELRPL